MLHRWCLINEPCLSFCFQSIAGGRHREMQCIGALLWWMGQNCSNVLFIKHNVGSILQNYQRFSGDLMIYFFTICVFWIFIFLVNVLMTCSSQLWYIVNMWFKPVAFSFFCVFLFFCFLFLLFFFRYLDILF